MDANEEVWFRCGAYAKESYCRYKAQIKHYTPGIDLKETGCLFEDGTTATWKEIHSRISEIVEEDKIEDAKPKPNYISNSRMRALDKVVFGSFPK